MSYDGTGDGIWKVPEFMKREKTADDSESALNDWLKTATELSDKRIAACKAAKPCPECGTNQVQLTEWIDSIEWKCRHCHHRWSGS